MCAARQKQKQACNWISFGGALCAAELPTLLSKEKRAFPFDIYRDTFSSKSRSSFGLRKIRIIQNNRGLNARRPCRISQRSFSS